LFRTGSGQVRGFGRIREGFGKFGTDSRELEDSGDSGGRAALCLAQVSRRVLKVREVLEVREGARLGARVSRVFREDQEVQEEVGIFMAFPDR
jgi:hypothetical protein